MNKIIALLAASWMLPGCGTITAAADTERGDSRHDAIEASSAPVAANDSGLGTITYDEKTRRPQCEKRRRTGSHLYQTGCSNMDSGSRPVKRGDWNSLGRYVVTGSSVANN